MVHIRPVPIPVPGGQHGHYNSNNNNNIVSGESAAGEFSTDENEEEESQTIEKNDDYDDHALLYDKNLDDEDEAYVYKHMRGGIREPVTTNGSGATSTSNVTPSTSNEDYPVASTAGAENSAYNNGEDNDPDGDSNNSGYNAIQNNDHTQDEKRNRVQLHRRQRPRRQVTQVYKPRSSDAVLSCPCCFNIVCMDCQRHRRYMNQFRAMFVMGVVVDWNNTLVYDDINRVLVPKVGYLEEEYQLQQEQQESNKTNRHGTSFEAVKNNGYRTKSEGYYSVECTTCRTQVAALDMTDEVYHFFGCLE